jgi:hypothetical protein
MSQVKLIVAADEPALFFASVEDAQSYLEAIDVENGVYGPVFGPNGEPYSISTDGHDVIIRATGEAPQPEALKALLLKYLAARGETPARVSSLSDLLERCTPRAADPRSVLYARLFNYGLALAVLGVLAWLIFG